MNGWKSLNPNGIPALFCHEMWDVIGHDVTATIRETLQSG